MKIQLLLAFLITGFTIAHSQSLDEGKKDVYYQRFASAENFFSNQLKQNPGNGEALLYLTKTYLLQKDVSRASDLIASAPASLHEEPYFLISKGAVCVSENKVDSGTWYFQRAVDMTKGKNTDVLAAIADMEILSENGDMSFALDIIQKAMKRTKNDAHLYVLKGNAHRNLHNGGEAFKAYTSAIEEDRNIAEAYYFLGEIFLSQKNPDLYIDYFNKAIKADPNYGPAYYELYNYYVYTKPDPQKAMQYFKQYEKLSDESIRHDYAYTDLLYLNKEYSQAISKAKDVIAKERDKVQPRLYKLIAYSYAESGDSASAVDYMLHYFNHEQDSNFIAKDFETMAQLYVAANADADSIVKYYQKAAAISQDSETLYKYYKDLANLAAVKKDHASQAKWLGLYYTGNDKASNVDLFNWGISAYRSENYVLADSVFGLYTEKYPDQGFGYYWRARTNAVIDSGMTAGLAIPYYNKLIETVKMDSLSATDKKWIVEAYAYIAAYEANTQRNYDKAIEYFDKVLEIDPENVNAKKYIAILEANGGQKEGSN